VWFEEQLGQGAENTAGFETCQERAIGTSIITGGSFSFGHAPASYRYERARGVSKRRCGLSFWETILCQIECEYIFIVTI
jgi:hypothetical protein